jgi:hypothetical protein
MAKAERARSINESQRITGVAMHADAPPTEERGHALLEEQIRTRAYELYLERGSKPNDDLGDWLRAEREYRGQARDDRSGSEDDHDWAH